MSAHSSRATSGTPSGTRATNRARILEITSPAGFEHFFREWDAATKDRTLDPEELGVRYRIELDIDNVPRLCAEHCLVHPVLG